VTGRTEEDPAASRLVGNMLRYLSDGSDASAARSALGRSVLYVGTPAGKRYLERAGITVGLYEGGNLPPDQVLVVGAGRAKLLAANKAAVADFLKAGGHLLAVGLDGAEANAFLPQSVGMKKAEHIASFFAPPGLGSLLAGVGPADVHNRAPRELALVSDGAKIVGNGVLAQAGNVVFCQLAPWSFVKAPDESPALTTSADEALEGKRCALLTMGTSPWGQLGQKVDAGRVGKTYTFAVFVKGVGEPVRARLEVERAGRPWDRAVRGQDTLVTADKWTELHVTFKVDKPYPEGWSAYVQCVQAEARLRADLFRLYEGAYVPGQPQAAGAAGARNLFANAGFETGVQPWFFNWPAEQENLRKTCRRTSFLLSRLLANLGAGGQTPLLSRFSTPASGAAGESVVANGDFRRAADKSGMPDGWQFSSGAKQATCVLEKTAPDGRERCLRIACTELGPKGGNVMLAQYNVPAQEGQWYLLGIKAKAQDFHGAPVNIALQSTGQWQSVIPYQRFTPREQWREFTFWVQAIATATSKTRFQIWHTTTGTLWLSDIRLTPCDPPSQGRWASGLYLDKVQEWDDPYRYFRW